MSPVEDGASWGVRVGPEQGHDGVQNGEPGDDDTQDGVGADVLLQTG